MNRTIQPAKKFSGTIRVPPDKSLTHRSIFFSAIADGVSTIENPLLAEDCLSTARCMETLGVKIERSEKKWTIHGKGFDGLRPSNEPLDCGNSGTTMRLLSGILSGRSFTSTLQGDASLSKRPMNRVSEPLSQMGAAFKMRDGKYAPFELTGTKNLKPLQWKNKVASAQVKSAVLLAALQAQGETIYEEPAPSRDHTERMLAACGVPIHRAGNTLKISGPAKLTPQHWIVPGDISSAAFFMVAGRLVPGANVRLEAVNINPTRTGILDVLKFKIENEQVKGGEPIADIVIDTQTPLKAFNIDEEISARLIDEIPVLAVAAAAAEGTSEFSGIEELRFKETDRLKAVATNLKTMGARVEEKKDGLIIHGPTKFKGAKLPSYDDHRIAMAFAVAALVATGETTIEHSECVAISFPNFWDLLDQLCR